MTVGEPHGRVVVVGAGQAGLTLATTLRENGWEGAIALIDAENETPYQRPPLSKAFLSGLVDDEALTLRPFDALRRDRIDHRGEAAQHIDLKRRSVRLSSGIELGYDHLVLATGATARRPLGEGLELRGAFTLRRRTDAVALRDHLAGARRMVIVGGGFIGLEVAAAVRARVPVTLLERASALLTRAVSPVTAARLVADQVAHGVEVRYESTLQCLTGADGAVTGVQLDTGEVLPADTVLVAIGAQPETGLAERSGLEVRDGIVVDELLRASAPDVFAIGDCARYVHPLLGRCVRMESVQNAVDQARFVASVLLGSADSPYAELPWFWSRQGACSLQIAGVAEPGDGFEAHADERPDRLTVLRLKDDRIVAVETINNPAHHVQARRLLRHGPAPVAEAGVFTSLPGVA